VRSVPFRLTLLDAKEAFAHVAKHDEEFIDPKGEGLSASE